MQRVAHVAVSTAVAFGVLVLLEGALRLAGFEREITPVSLRFGYPDPREIGSVFTPDPELFWRLRPGSEFDAEASVAINPLGYRGPVPLDPRPAGRTRIAVLGDSVAFGGAVAWPEILADRTGAEVLNFGVPGYTVVQGSRQWARDVAPLRPDVVVVAYGWNDHWVAKGGLPDSARTVPSRGRAAFELGLSRLRLAQAAHAILGTAASAEPGPAPPGATRRVPPSDYRETLDRLLAAASGSGARVLVLALPSGLRESDFPSYLLDLGFTPSARDAIEDHARWAALARDAAEKHGAAFLDPSDRFASAGLFSRDGIHPSAEGHHVLAEAVEGALPR
ncbi:MAG TPA: SGNH/GDSL hydrolase family protein [Candidatus Polarisedimenticolaceae bacterium]